MLLILVLAVGIGIGFLISISAAFVADISGKSRKELKLTRKNLRIAEAALRKVANPVTGNPQLEADIALQEIDLNNDK